MIAREAVLNDTEIVKLLSERFVPIAIDNVEHPNMTPAEKAFLAERGGKFSTQGMSVFTADGKVLGMGGGFEPEGVKRMLTEALTKFTPEDAPAIEKSTDSKELAAIRRPPEGGLVLYVTWKVLGGVETPQSSPTSGDGAYDKTFGQSLGVDRVWVRRDEAEALARGEFPRSLSGRMGRHVSYALVGDVHHADLTLGHGKLAGSFDADAGDPAPVLGFIESQGGKVTRFDVLVKGWGGRVEDCGFAAALTVVQKHRKVPVGILFELADPADDLSRVVPHRAKDETYLR